MRREQALSGLALNESLRNVKREVAVACQRVERRRCRWRGREEGEGLEESGHLLWRGVAQINDRTFMKRGVAVCNIMRKGK